MTRTELCSTYDRLELPHPHPHDEWAAWWDAALAELDAVTSAPGASDAAKRLTRGWDSTLQARGWSRRELAWNLRKSHRRAA